jgi:cardiolipin synthase
MRAGVGGTALARSSRVRWTCLLVGLGLVAVAGCARVTPHLELPALRDDAPAFTSTLEAYAGGPLLGGHTVDILLNGDEIFPAELAAIRAATTSITYSQYDYEDGPVARELAETLAERCRAGVAAHVLLDGFGSLAIPLEHVETMRRSGCQVVFFRPPLTSLFIGDANNRNHRRVLVVDGRVGFTGGAGVSEKWMGDGRTPGHWRDTDVRVEGPVVQYLQAAFAEMWLQATGVVLGGEGYFPSRAETPGTVRAMVVTSSPVLGDYAMYTSFLLAIEGARRSVFITNPYFVPDAKMEQALIDAVGRGVRVVVLVPGEIDHNLVRQASRAGFGRLLRAGIEIYEYAAALLHAKTMVVDALWSAVGSTNLDNRSFALNAELNLVVRDEGVARRLTEVFGDDLRRSRRVEYQHWRARPLWQRLLEVLVLPIRDQL